MSHLDVLHALLRLSRRRKEPTLAALVAACGLEEAAARRAVFSLAKQSLVQRTPAGLRLTLAGFAIAVASAQLELRPRLQAASPAAASVTRAIHRTASRSRSRRAA